MPASGCASLRKLCTVRSLHVDAMLLMMPLMNTIAPMPCIHDQKQTIEETKISVEQNMRYTSLPQIDHGSLQEVTTAFLSHSAFHIIHWWHAKLPGSIHDHCTPVCCTRYGESSTVRTTRHSIEGPSRSSFSPPQERPRGGLGWN